MDAREAVLLVLEGGPKKIGELIEESAALGCEDAEAVETAAAALVADGTVHKSPQLGNFNLVGRKSLRAGSESSDWTGLEAYLIYSSEIEPDSYIHINIVGNHYALRGYAGKRGVWGPSWAGETETPAAFWERYPDALADRVPVAPRSVPLDSAEGRKSWHRKIADLNAKKGIG